MRWSLDRCLRVSRRKRVGGGGGLFGARPLHSPFRLSPCVNFLDRSNVFFVSATPAFPVSRVFFAGDGTPSLRVVKRGPAQETVTEFGQPKEVDLRPRGGLWANPPLLPAVALSTPKVFPITLLSFFSFNKELYLTLIRCFRPPHKTAFRIF